MKRIMINADKCDGCLNCSFACMSAHRTGGDAGDDSFYTLNLADPANQSRNHIDSDGRGGYIPLFCRHCDEPKCIEACMSGALSKSPETGLVSYDEEKCGKCFMCVMSCPFGMASPDRTTRTRVVKCDFCSGKDYNPSCVASCPKKAITVEEVNV